MKMHLALLAGVVLVGSLPLEQVAFADASFQETTQITGGTLADAMKPMAFMSKSIGNMFAPNTTTTMVHGNQKAVVGKESTEIIDLDKETITRIDNVKKTYTVVTFAQMRQAMKDAPAQMQKAQEQVKQAPPQKQQSDIKTSFDVSVKNTGVSKVVNGLTAQEQLVTMTMTATDPNAPAGQPSSVQYVVTTDAWIAPDPPQVKEVQDFDVRMGKKLMEGMDTSAFVKQMQGGGNSGMAMMFANKPGASDAMVEMGKEMAKLQGTRVMEVMSMGGAPGAGGAAGAPAQAPAASPTPAPTKMGMLGAALGGSALGRFGRKSTPPPAAAPDPNAPADGGGGGGGAAATGSGVLMSMTTQKANFSSDAVPASAFTVPGGYKLVQSPGMK